MNSTQMKNTFWYGTHYYRPPTPLAAEWEEDFKRIKDHGLTTIQFRVFWTCYERAEGKYTWDDLDAIMDLSHKHGLSAVHQINLENAPPYIFNRYEGYRVDIRGQRIWPIANAGFYPGGWIPCFDHPQVMGRGVEFVRRLVERYKKHPAMNFWHAWNEPRSRPMGECACEYSVRSYRQWLKEKFGTVEALNARYGKYWPDFDSIDAARDTSDFAEMYLWRQWAASRVYDRVANVVRTVRELDADHAVISHVGLNNMQNDILPDMSDDIQMANVADLYGSSFEVRYTPEPLVHSQPFLICEWMRHVGRGDYSIYELYPSRGRFEEEIPAHQFQQWLWTPVACGASGIFLWQYKKERLGHETNDAGLVETDGSDNPTSLEAEKTFAIFKKMSPEISGWRVPSARIAMVYDLKSDLVNRLEQTVQRDGDYVGRYDLRWKLPVGHAYKAALQGLYHLFWMKNIHLDVVSVQRLTEMVDQYDVMYLPYMQVVDAERAELLLKFAARGGRLIVDGGFADRDANSWLHTVRPMPAISEGFGYRQQVQLLDPALRAEAQFQDEFRLKVAYQKVEFKTATARTLARWPEGSPAAVTSDHGKGKVLALGFSPGISYLMTEDSTWAEFIESIVREWAGIENPWWTGINSHPDMTLRELRDSKGKSVVFTFRRWTRSRTGDTLAWQTGILPEAKKTLDLSHVRCFLK